MNRDGRFLHRLVSRYPRAHAYWIALLLVAGVGAMRPLLFEPAGITAPFMLFYPVIAWSAYLGGLGPGVLATASTALMAGVFLHPAPTPVNWMWISLFAPLLISTFAHLRVVNLRNARLAYESGRLQFVVDRVSDWIFLTGHDGVIQYANRTACMQLEIPSTRLIGRPLADFAAEPNRAAVRDLLARCCQEVVQPVEVFFERGGGSVVAVEIGCTAVSAGDASLIHVAGRDITERKLVARRLSEARQWEGLRVLSGGIAHDFNNLLASMIGNASLAQEMLEPDHPVSGLLTAIEEAGERSADLIRMMLAASGYRSRVRENLQLDLVLSKLLAKRSVPEGIVVTSRAEETAIESDSRSLEMLLWGLISNAAESYATGSGEVSVCICALPEPAITVGQADFEEGEMPPGTSVEIIVADHGCGMTSEVLEHAFDPFFSTRFIGRGLGLPAVRGIVRAHEGKLRLHTKPGVGTTVEIWLPVARYHVSASA